MPVFWFSANATGQENPQMQALIAKYPVAILAWQLGTNEPPVFRHGEAKLHAQAAALASSAPSTEVLIYIQGQLAIDWYESTRAMLPPPCGADAAGASPCRTRVARVEELRHVSPARHGLHEKAR